MTAFIKTAQQELEFIATTHDFSEEHDGGYRLAVYERDSKIPQLRRVVDFITVFNVDEADIIATDFETAPEGTVIDFSKSAQMYYGGAVQVEA